MAEAFQVWRCRNCGFEYDEEAGCPEGGLAPGTRWVDVPDDWICPTCGSEKQDFDMVALP